MRSSIALALFALACSPAQREWRLAKRSDTSAAYRAFAQANPTDPHRAEALERTEQLDWQHAVTRDSVDAWTTYVAFHPGSTRIGEARAKLEGARWKQAVDEGSRQGFDMYLGSHPTGPHADEARAKLDEIAWAEADREGTIESYGKYLVRFKTGPHAAEASRKREELFWRNARDTDDPMQYRVYLAKYPSGTHADEAKGAIEGFRFSGVALRVIVKSTVRGDSIKTWKPSLESSLAAKLREEGFKVSWMDVIDARGKVVDPFSELLTMVPEDHAALIVVLEESKGRAFDPSGFATDVDAEVFVVPPARVQPFITKEVDASTSGKVRVENEQGLHVDAQKQLGYEIAKAKLGLSEWKR
ncbi:MAG: hypothetical protein H6737_00345 [Alphaproteobacteria bacterium]|nr:hypothetical protein [Alphaproteobacteria bacterium]